MSETLSPKQTLKIVILSKLAAEGLTPDEMLTRVTTPGALEKLAVLDKLMDFLGGYALPVAMAAPPALGFAAGHMLGKSQDLGQTGIDEVKDREVLDEYQRATNKLKRENELRGYRQQLTRLPSRPAY